MKPYAVHVQDKERDIQIRERFQQARGIRKGFLEKRERIFWFFYFCFHLFGCGFLFLFLFACCIVKENRKHEEPKQGAGNLQGWFGDIKETSWPRQTSEGPECWVRACGHSRSDIQIFSNWWYRRETDTGRENWYRVLKALAARGIDILDAWLKSRSAKAGAKGLGSRGTPGLWAAAVYPSVWNDFYGARRLASAPVQQVRADATEVVWIKGQLREWKGGWSNTAGQMLSFCVWRVLGSGEEEPGHRQKGNQIYRVQSQRI